LFNNLIPIITDFDNYYFGIFKALLISENKDITIIKIGEIKDYNILTSIFFLITSIKYFSPGTLFVVLFDPCPFSNDYILCHYKGFYILSSNNGSFSPFIKDGDFYLINKKGNNNNNDNIRLWSFMVKNILSSNIENFDIYPKEYVNFIYYQPVIKDNIIEASIFYIDGFGNIITNIPNTYFDKLKTLEIKSKIIEKSDNFKDVKETAFIRGSQGFIEIVANKKSAKKILNVNEKINILGRIQDGRN